MPNSLSEKIKYLRALHGLTLEEVAIHVGVGKSTVRKWETGQIANMRRDKIAKLAVALHTTPGYLMGWDDEECAESPVLTDAEDAMLFRFRQLNQEGQNKVLSYVDDLIRAEIYKNQPDDHIVHKKA